MTRRPTDLGCLLSVRMAEAAAMLSISKDHLWRLTARNEVPHRRIGGRCVLYSVDALREWLRGDVVVSPGAVDARDDGGETARSETTTDQPSRRSVRAIRVMPHEPAEVRDRPSPHMSHEDPSGTVPGGQRHERSPRGARST